jgi:hypothetical protein
MGQANREGGSETLLPHGARRLGWHWGNGWIRHGWWSGGDDDAMRLNDGVR